jgi:2-dehydro-3-deoxyphosphogluconate aldolase/(4S)-4-hydroxy-2-oxoglutarate aldolase
MATRQETRERIVDSGVTAVLRGIDGEDVVPVAEAIYDGGVTAIEVTADAKRPGELIAAVDRALADTEAVVGAGTVMDAAAARTVVDAGAEFVLAPNLNEAVVETCNRVGAVAIPGVMTPTEADRALAAGADMLKLFPASTVGPGHVSAIRGPLGDVDVVPTGGITTDDVADFFAAGAVAVGAGSALVDYEAIEAGDMDAVRDRAAAFAEAVADARS